jgi:hypothetical protein
LRGVGSVGPAALLLNAWLIAVAAIFRQFVGELVIDRETGYFEVYLFWTAKVFDVAVPRTADLQRRPPELSRANGAQLIVIPR